MEGPLLALVPRAASLEERVKAIRQMRPRFPVPEKISAVWWPRYIERLTEDGIWEAVLQRVIDAGYPETAEEAAVVLEELRRMERAEVADAIGGEGYRTLWPARTR